MMEKSTPQMFLSGLRANMAVKDLEAMWPVGLISTAAIYGEAIALTLEGALKVARPSGPTYSSTFPTSYLVSLAICVMGAIHSKWPRDRILELVERYLRYAQQNKVGPILNGTGANTLFCSSEAGAIENSIRRFRQPSEDKVRLVNRLSAAILAVAEATFFQFHRVATEKHGPYHVRNGPGCLLIRSVSTLVPPVELWPELTMPSELARLDDVNLVWMVSSTKYRFDGFSNLMHDFDSNAETRSLALFDRHSGEVSPIDRFSTTDLSSLLAACHIHLVNALHAVHNLPICDLRERLIGSLFYANRELLADGGSQWRLALETAVGESESDGRNGSRRPNKEAIMHEIDLLIG